MNIGFDAKRAVQNHTGLGNYSRFIIDIMSRYYPADRYLLYAPRKRENKELDVLLRRPGVAIRYPSSFWGKQLSSLWRVWGIGKELRPQGIDLFHGLSNELPLTIRKSRVRSIVTIHDLIMLRYPQYYTWIDRHIYAYKFRKACLNSDHIIAVSETTKKDIMDFWGIPEG